MNGTVEQTSLLIISDDPQFARVIMDRWQSERNVPAFTLMSSDVSLSFDPESFQLAIAGSIRPQALSVVLEALEAAGKRVIFVSQDAGTLETVRQRWPGLLMLREQDGWLDAMVSVVNEAVHRVEAESRAIHAEATNAMLDRQATLGRYMLEMRHSLNNALTSVLGNAELLLLEPGSLSAEARSQIETIRNMGVRMHEVLQRFSSLEKELSVVDCRTGIESGSRSRAAAAVQ